MIRRPPRSTQSRSSAASDVYKRQHMQNVELKANTLEFYYGSQAPGGYAWGFPKGNDAGNIGLGVLGSKLNDKRPLDYLKKFVAQHFPNGKPVELIVGGCPVSDALPTIIGDGLM